MCLTLLKQDTSYKIFGSATRKVTDNQQSVKVQFRDSQIFILVDVIELTSKCNFHFSPQKNHTIIYSLITKQAIRNQKVSDCMMNYKTIILLYKITRNHDNITSTYLCKLSKLT